MKTNKQCILYMLYGAETWTLTADLIYKLTTANLPKLEIILLDKNQNKNVIKKDN